MSEDLKKDIDTLFELSELGDIKFGSFISDKL